MDLRFEFRRQIAHVLLGVITIYIYLFTDVSPVWLLWLALVSGCLFFVNKFIKLPFVNALVIRFERTEAIKQSPGMGFVAFLTGCALTLLVFDKDIAMAAIIVLSLGDSFSTLVGKVIGQIRVNHYKTLEGSIAGWLIAFNAAMFFVSPLEALVAATTGMIIELLSIRFRWLRIEDNLLIPLFAGLGVYALRLFV